MTSDYRLTKFVTDGDEFPGNGFAEIGQNWNGWAKPKFTKQQIENYLQTNGWNYSWDENILVIHWEGQEDQRVIPDRFEMYEPDGLEWVEVE